MAVYDVCAMQGDISTELRGERERGLAITWNSRKRAFFILEIIALISYPDV